LPYEFMCCQYCGVSMKIPVSNAYSDRFYLETVFQHEPMNNCSALNGSSVEPN